jgi:hypothetical protein
MPLEIRPAVVWGYFVTPVQGQPSVFGLYLMGEHRLI